MLKIVSRLNKISRRIKSLDKKILTKLRDFRKMHSKRLLMRLSKSKKQVAHLMNLAHRVILKNRQLKASQSVLLSRRTTQQLVLSLTCSAVLQI